MVACFGIPSSFHMLQQFSFLGVEMKSTKYLHSLSETNISSVLTQ